MSSNQISKYQAVFEPLSNIVKLIPETQMKTVSVRELKRRASELIRMVRENGSEIRITYRGKVVARLIPFTRAYRQEEAQAWADIDRLAAEIGARWPAGLAAEEAVAEGRR
jgi:prevent-host-death family protein